VQILEPAVARLGVLEAEEASVDDFLDVDAAVVCLDDLGAVVELLDEGEDAETVLGGDLGG
jgi:hypothetical protein